MDAITIEDGTPVYRVLWWMANWGKGDAEVYREEGVVTTVPGAEGKYVFRGTQVHSLDRSWCTTKEEASERAAAEMEAKGQGLVAKARDLRQPRTQGATG